MTLTGKQKAAMLLMSLDMATASELLKGIDPKLVQELAVELAYLDAAGYHDKKQGFELVEQFYNDLTLQGESELNIQLFLKEMLKSTVGQDKADQIQSQMQDILQRRDPFMPIRSAEPHRLASLLETEHPQAVAVVLSELPTKKSSEVLGLLGEGIRFSAIGRMTSSEAVTPEAKTRIAKTVCKRLKDITPDDEEAVVSCSPEQALRKVAVILRNLGKELRDGLLGTIEEKDKQVSERVAELMVLWEDIPQVADRSLQKVLRVIDARKLALAFVGADDTLVQKIKLNISEQAAATLNEETSPGLAAKKKDVEEARETIVQVLREMNEKGELVFTEE